MGKLHSSAWKRAWKKAGLPNEKGIRKGVHNLRHYSEFRIIPSKFHQTSIVLLLSLTCVPPTA
jgi:hypothetical protein